jgi:hypothetical protein
VLRGEGAFHDVYGFFAPIDCEERDGADLANALHSFPPSRAVRAKSPKLTAAFGGIGGMRKNILRWDETSIF